MPRPRLALLAVFLLLAANGSRAADSEDGTPATQVHALVAKYGVRAGEPGVGVLVVGPKGVLFKKGYGVANLAQRTPVTAATTFELASVSKQVTGVAVLLLVQQGKVRVGDEVRKHLPEFPSYDARHPITVDHLSRHTSGLPDYFDWDVAPGAKRTYYTNADALADLARRKSSSPLASVPGTTYDYSNTGYMVLAALVERVSGLSFGAFLSKTFFEPLGMRTAWVHESPRVPAVATAVGYTFEDERWQASWSAPTAERREKHLTVGDGGAWASLDDLAAWDRGLRAGTPLKQETLLRALAPDRGPGGEPSAYAMGWELEYDEQGAVVTLSHGGSWEGFETFLGHDLARELTVAVLSNRRGFKAEEFAEAVGTLFRR